MSNEKDPAVAVAAALSEVTRGLNRRAYDATNPIFRREGGRRECSASCVIIRIASRVAVVTAAHAISPGTHYEFGAGDQILPFAGKARRVLAPDDSGTRANRVDLIVLLLPPAVGDRIADGLPIEATELDTLSELQEKPTYLAIGFPYSKQRQHRRRIENAATAHSLLVTRPGLSDYAELAFDPLVSLILKFNKKDMYRDGAKTVGPDPIGMSGGSVWLLPGFGTSRPRPARLAGIMIEWHQGAKRIIATRAHVAFSLLAELDPALAPHLPALRFGN